MTNFKNILLILFGILLCVNCSAQENEANQRLFERLLKNPAYIAMVKQDLDVGFRQVCTSRPEYIAQCFGITSAQCVEVVDNTESTCLENNQNFTYRPDLNYSLIDNAAVSLLTKCIEANINNRIYDLGGTVSELDSCNWRKE